MKSGRRGPGGIGMQEFGGRWTETKLEVLARYLQKYTIALKKTHFTKIYIDAFAGTGYRTRREPTSSLSMPLFPDLAEEDAQRLLDGSARRALKNEPRFDRYVFIDVDPDHCEILEALKAEFPALAPSIQVLTGDANEELQRLCEKRWSDTRAVLFLDPYGMQVEWRTMEAIAATRAIDTWILFPLGMGVNRLLPRSGEIPESWRRRLDEFLGRTDWYEKFYRVETDPNMFEDDQQRVIKAGCDTIGKYFVERLREVFADVSPEPRILCNKRNSPLYLLCFAVANQAGSKIALRIANHLLRTVM